MQQAAGLLGIQHQLRLAGDRRAKIWRRLRRRRHAALHWQTGVGPVCQPPSSRRTSLTPAYSMICATAPRRRRRDRRGSPWCHGGCRASPASPSAAHRTLYSKGVRSPPHWCRYSPRPGYGSADRASALPGGLKHFPVAGRGGSHAFPLQIVQPLRVDQLFKVRQLCRRSPGSERRSGR